MTMLVNEQPRDWYFWLGASAHDDAPRFYVVLEPIEGEFNMLPGGITWVKNEPRIAWWRA